ncbi:MAG TPA: hypothetical protein DCM28_17260 [Phycisphaerales bacterium]|nr:hypothetical protein [Phycisphaerales bacterium]HCD31876.1 hypothetical protein [Phycisphaerales bacterium]|tara:strand:- start:195 stop:1229 length:1035 start_codon:yes stop_codon:yes gene_type:complete
MVTIREIAQSAGVSPATVSLVLNNSPRVAVQTRELVEQSVKTLGYEPRQAGRPRRAHAQSGMRHHVGFVTSRPMSQFKRTLLYLDVLDGINAALASEQSTSQFVHVDLDQPLPRELVEKQFEGLIVLGPELVPVLQELDPAIAFVQVMGAPVFNANWDQVTCNNQLTAELAGRYLLKQGHKHIAILDVEDHNQPHAIRNKSFAEFAIAQGARVRINPALKLQKGVLLHTQLVAPLKHLFKGKSRPTALYCAADMYTAAVYPALTSIGLRPGIDVCIASSNNESNIFAALDPQPVSVDLNPFEIGYRAATTLLRRIQSPQVPCSLQLISPSLPQLDEDSSDVNNT